ncbi:TetR/AcrR family transcriptional regulator [Actinokineospora bangkokensis]|uniref:TetR family transcriptional regulator n=1 Tax=Actinokineospora bangkokensis TaxID=1193682 RepID=A0A1Q9LJD4_9PSEU|nr:TetR/AcrR family transcriptional regulator [Actinokineospora bangkokensis]OLR92162.1 TetR family transcriptional regulator [Actinokineospora bangkokensis]
MAKDGTRGQTRQHSGGGDPARSLSLLWRDPRTPARTGRRELSVERIVTAAIEVADREGVVALSMRRVADALGVGTMSLYTYVPGKAELVDLMLDTVYAETDKPEQVPGGWRARLEQVARENWALFHRHPWMLQLGVSRPPLGPNVLAKYDYELHAFAGTGLREVEMDTVLNLVVGHAENTARRSVDARAAQRDPGVTDEQWWQSTGQAAGSLVDFSRFPLAASVAEAVGAAYGTSYDAAHNFDAGLARILDGVAVLVAQRQAEGSGGA